jgi:hypothetical protein
MDALVRLPAAPCQIRSGPPPVQVCMVRTVQTCGFPQSFALVAAVVSGAEARVDQLRTLLPAPGCSGSCGGSTTTWSAGPTGNTTSDCVTASAARWNCWQGPRVGHPDCSRTGGSARVLMAGRWEPDESRLHVRFCEGRRWVPPATHLVILVHGIRMDTEALREGAVDSAAMRCMEP